MTRSRRPKPTPIASTPAAPEWRSATEQLAAMAAGELSSVELVERYLARHSALNPALNAIVTVDADGALEAAARADAARASGDPVGPLNGLPITLKDAYETAGMRSVCGQPGLRDYVPRVDAEPVARLRAAGAVILGKTNMPTANADVQSSNPVFGRSNNPWDLSRTPGGSAGGGAAATAAGLTSLDYGSEIGGSTRIPAHFCGLYGHKVTWRSVPLVGHLPPGPGTGRWAEPDMACAGAQARDPRDLLLAVEATVGTHRRDGGFRYELAAPRATQLADFRVAIWSEDPACPVDADARAAIDMVRTALRDSGASLTEQPVELPIDIAGSHRIFERLLYGAFSVDRSTISPRSAAGLLARTVQRPGGETTRVLTGTAQSHRAWLAAHAERERLRDAWAVFFDSFDVVVMPVAPTAAPPHHNKDHDRWGRTILVDGERRSYWDQTKWCGLANIAGAPATTIPVLRSKDGLPVGVQVMGPAGGDRTTIAFATLLGDVLGGFARPPRAVAA